MPGRDGSGPRGMGSMTGRGLGYCSAEARPGYGIGRGLGMGRRTGYGRGFRRDAYGAMTLEEERAWLRDRLNAIDNEIDATKEK